MAGGYSGLFHLANDQPKPKIKEHPFAPGTNPDTVPGGAGGGAAQPQQGRPLTDGLSCQPTWVCLADVLRLGRGTQPRSGLCAAAPATGALGTAPGLKGGIGAPAAHTLPNQA